MEYINNEQELNEVSKEGIINVDNEPELAVKFGIVSIPTVLIFKDGALVKSEVGFMTKDDLNSIIDEIIA